VTGSVHCSDLIPVAGHSGCCRPGSSFPYLCRRTSGFHRGNLRLCANLRSAFLFHFLSSFRSHETQAIVALLNDARLAKGLPTLGFLNPLLYSDKVAKTFNDITIGNNPGCGTPGFNSTKGWDPGIVFVRISLPPPTDRNFKLRDSARRISRNCKLSSVSTI
jgi:hypothetical protein